MSETQKPNRKSKAAKEGRKPRLAFFKFTSCDGCQLSLLDAEGDLLTVADEVEIAYFLEARRQAFEGPYDICLVEGSITTPEEVGRIQEVRHQSKFLVTIGACATAAGIQALRNWRNVDDFVHLVYATPAYITTLATSTPIGEHVAVDFELRGCPINKLQLLELITALLIGRQPHVPTYSVCIECKRRGIVCVMVAQGIPCLGPVTQAGCEAICPAYSRGCYGCYGPMEAPNPDPLGQRFQELGASLDEITHLFRGFTGYADVFRIASNRYEEMNR